MPAKSLISKGAGGASVSECRILPETAGFFAERGHNMHQKAQIMDENAMKRALMRLSHEIVEKNKGAANLVFVGIRRRGEPIAELVRENIAVIEGIRVPCGSIDIKFYRDDLSTVSESPEIRKASLPFDVNGRDVVLFDDVLYTGPSRPCSAAAGRRPFSSRSWWTADIGSFRSGRILWERTCPPPGASWWKSASRNTTARPACT